MSDVINDTVYAIDFIDNAAGHGIEKFPRQSDDLSGHGVNAVDGADGDDIVVGAFVIFHTDGFDGDENCESLPCFVIPSGLEKFFGNNGVCFAEDVQS